MILGVACLLAFGLAWALGADLRALARVRLRWSGLILAALGLQLLVFAAGVHAPAALGGDTGVHLGSYLLLIAFALRNLRVPGFPLAAAGLAANAAAIFSNGGHMPVSLAAWRETGHAVVRTDASVNTSLLTSGTHLSFLGDVFALPAWLPLANTFSIGDVLLVAGAVLFVHRGGRRGRAGTSVLSLAPLRDRDVRALLAGRSVSQLGDWLALAALVGWVYGRTHSTLGVAVLLLARLLGSAAGGAVGGLLGGRDRFPLLCAIDAARAVTMLGALGLVAAGQPSLVAACVLGSSLLAGAADPAAGTLVADLLPPEERRSAHALDAVLRTAAMAAGALAGALVAARVGVGAALVADLAALAVAAALAASSLGRVAAPARRLARRPRREDVAAVLAHGRMRALVLSAAVATAALALLNASLPAFLAAHAPGGGGYGVALAAVALGLTCGELAGGRIGAATAARAPALAFAVSAGLVALAATSRLATTVLLLLFLLGAVDGATGRAYEELVRRHAPRPRRRGAFAVGGVSGQGAMALGLALAPLLAGGGTAAALRASAAALAAAALVAVGVAAAGRVVARGPEPVAPSV